MDSKQQTKYPIFSGRVVGVPLVVEEREGEVFTYIQYLTPNDEPTMDDVKEALPLGILSMFDQKAMEKANETLAEKVNTAIVPLRVDPSVLHGAEVRTCLGQLNSQEYGEGPSLRTYEVQVIKGTSRAGGDFLSGFAEMSAGTPHTGMKYIKILD
jgi:hypothetical protein